MKILGIDVGGSGIKGAIVDLDTGTLENERLRIETPQPATPEAISQTIAKLVKEFNWTGKIGVGFPANVQNGVVKTATNIDKTCINVNFEKLIFKITGCETKVLNDADAAALAEIKYGHGKNINDLIFTVTIGTGVGTAIFYQQKLIPNMELGHVYLSNGKLVDKYLSDATRKAEELSWEDWTDRFNKYLDYISILISPQLIILGGGISKKFEKISKHISKNHNLKTAMLLNEAGIIGAAYWASAL